MKKATPTKGSKDTKQPQGKDEKDENVSSNNDRLEFRALIEEAAMGHNYPYVV